MAPGQMTSKPWKGSLWGISLGHHRAVAENCALGTKATARTAAPVWGAEATTPPLLPFGDPYPAEGWLLPFTEWFLPETPPEPVTGRRGRCTRQSPVFTPIRSRKALAPKEASTKECGPWSPWLE